MPTLPSPFVADAVWKTQTSRWDDGVRSVTYAPHRDAETTGSLTVASAGTIPASACSAFAAWLGEQVPLTVGSSDAGVVWTLASQPSRIPTVAAFAATAWWLRACAAGVEPFTALGTIAHAWSRTPLPAAVAWAFLPRAGLLGWTPTGAASAMVHVRLLDDPSASPGLRLALAHSNDGPSAERVATRAVWTSHRDRAIEQAADDHLMSTPDHRPFSWSFWHLEPGMGPEDLRGMIRRVESFVELWPQLQPLQEQLARQGGIEEIGGHAWERPAVAGRQNASTSPAQPATPYAETIAAPAPTPPAEHQASARTNPVAEVAPGTLADPTSAASVQPAAAPADVIAAEQSAPTVVHPAVAVVIPVANEPTDEPDRTSAPVASDTADAADSASVPVPPDTSEVPDVPFSDPHSSVSASDSAPLKGHDDDWSPPSPTPVELPRVAAPLPASVHSAPEQELPSPGAPGRFRVELIDPGPNPTRTAELLARALRVSVDEAAAWCAAAPVCVATDIPAYEVRKIDVVVRLPSGARFSWSRTDNP